MTYSQGLLQLLIRAYLLDSLPIGRVQLGNFIFTLFIGMGCCLGSVLSAVDWSELIAYKPSETTDIKYRSCKVKVMSDFVKINYEVFRFVWHLSKEMWLL